MRPAALFASLLLPASALAQNVIVVDDTPGPGVDQSTIQAAVDAGGPNDVILVRPGTYAGFTIDQESARIFGDGANVDVAGVVTIQNLAAGQVAVLNGIQISSMSGTAFEAFACTGTVWLEDVSISSSGVPVFLVNDGARVTTCDDVLVADCTIVSGNGGLGGGSGLLAQGSTVTLYDTTVQGGLVAGGLPGSPGLSSIGSEVYAGNCTLLGGQGGDGTLQGPFQICTDGAQGGPAVSATFGFGSLAAADVELFGCTLVGGAGGAPGGAACVPGSGGPGVFTDLDSNVDVETPVLAAPRTYSIPNPTNSGQLANLEFTGTPGELAWGVFSATQDLLEFPLFEGVFAPGGPNQIFLFVGAIPASGPLVLPVTVNLPPGKSQAVVWEQGLFFSLEDGFVLGTPRASLILGTSF